MAKQVGVVVRQWQCPQLVSNCCILLQYHIFTAFVLTVVLGYLWPFSPPLARIIESCLYMLMSHYQKAGQKHCIKIVYRSFEDMAKFRYLGTTLTDQNCMHKEIKSRLNSGNACYHSVQSLLSSCLLARNVKVKICKTIMLLLLFRSRRAITASGAPSPTLPHFPISCHLLHLC
jgi:hypothetical protein